MPGLILTPDEYAVAIRKHFHRAVEIERARQAAMTIGTFTSWALRRFKEFEPVYGPLVLTSRNWIHEQAAELVDSRAYGIFELEQKARKL